MDARSETTKTKSCLPGALQAQPNVWITAEKWLNAIPETSGAEILVKGDLKDEFAYLLDKLHEDGNAEVCLHKKSSSSATSSMFSSEDH